MSGDQIDELSVFEAFPKIPRLQRGVVVSEKIDGTNAQILIVPDQPRPPYESIKVTVSANNGVGMVGIDAYVLAGSRSRMISPGKATDNHGFAGWVWEHASELAQLGIGRHFGEWYGRGIQRGYGLSEKRFALFNSARWNGNNPPPACCEVVPVLGGCAWHDVDKLFEQLRSGGSRAAPGFMEPEGIIVYHPASRGLFKQTFDNDDQPKSKLAADA